MNTISYVIYKTSFKQLGPNKIIGYPIVRNNITHNKNKTYNKNLFDCVTYAKNKIKRYELFKIKNLCNHLDDDFLLVSKTDNRLYITLLNKIFKLER